MLLVCCCSVAFAIRGWPFVFAVIAFAICGWPVFSLLLLLLLLLFCCVVVVVVCCCCGLFCLGLC